MPLVFNLVGKQMWTFIWIHVKSPARKFYSRTISVMFAICVLLLLELKSHKQTLPIKHVMKIFSL